ncbi:MAG: class I SAM-dependent methyltransferase [Burkholderiales bacterium]
MKQWSHLDAQRVLDDQIESWWFQGKRTIFDALFQGKIPADSWVLDVGAGQGLFLNHLVAPGRLVAVDEWMFCLERNRARGGIPVNGDALHLPFRESFDYLFALDVLEHLPDDRAAVGEWARVLKPGGRLVINVPALDCLWSEHDVQMGHYRRYDRAKLRGVFEDCGLRPQRITYTNSFLFPLGWLCFRLKLHKGNDSNPEAHLPLPAMVTSAIGLCYRIEAAWLKHCYVPFGGSIIGIAAKPGA